MELPWHLMQSARMPGMVGEIPSYRERGNHGKPIELECMGVCGVSSLIRWYNFWDLLGTSFDFRSNWKKSLDWLNESVASWRCQSRGICPKAVNGLLTIAAAKKHIRHCNLAQILEFPAFLYLKCSFSEHQVRFSAH